MFEQNHSHQLAITIVPITQVIHETCEGFTLVPAEQISESQKIVKISFRDNSPKSSSKAILNGLKIAANLRRSNRFQASFDTTINPRLARLKKFISRLN